MRTSRSQFELLLTYMEQYGDLSKPLPIPNGRRITALKWEELTEKLNKDLTGDSKTVNKWQRVWSDLKNNTKRKFARIHRGESDTKVNELEKRVLNLVGTEASTDLDSGEASVSRIPHRVKKFRQSCINLVKVHNRPLDLFDDEAFRWIVDLLWFRVHDAKYKNKFSSEQVKAWIDSDDHGNGNDEDSNDVDEEGEMEVEVPAANDSESDTSTEFSKLEVPTCTCSTKNHSGDFEHHVDCPLADNQPYWGYFEVSLDDATCRMCHKKLYWNNFCDLKSHLLSIHPGVKFK